MERPHITDVYMDMRNTWGAEIADEIMDRIFDTPFADITWKEFISNRCIACGGAWVTMIATGIRSIAPSVWDALPDHMGEPFHAFALLCDLAMILGVEPPLD